MRAAPFREAAVSLSKASTSLGSTGEPYSEWQVGGAIIARRPKVGVAGADGVTRASAFIAYCGDAVGRGAPFPIPSIPIAILDARCGRGDLAEGASVQAQRTHGEILEQRIVEEDVPGLLVRRGRRVPQVRFHPFFLLPQASSGK